MLKEIRNIIFANRDLCYLCRQEDRKEESYICRSCYERLDILDEEEKIDSPYLSEVYYSLFYNRFIREKIGDYKFNGKNYLYKPFGQLMLDTARKFKLEEKIDLIFYIPSHRRKEAKRGYNQAELLADFLAREMKKEVSKGNLVKTRSTKAQSSLKRIERIDNLKDSLKLKRRKEINSKTILLIDDIITTGTTMEESSRLLKENGAKDVIGLTLTSTKTQ